MKKTKCPYCPEDMEDDDEYNEHIVLMHPSEIDDYKNVLNGGDTDERV